MDTNTICAVMDRASGATRPRFQIGASFRTEFDASGSRLVTLGKRITLWDVRAGKRIATGPSLKHASSVDVSPDGCLVAAKNTLGEVLVLDAKTLEEVARFSGKPYGEGTGVRFTNDSKAIVDGSWAGHLIVRDALTGEVVWDELEGDESVMPLAPSRDRRVWAYVRTPRGTGSRSVRVLVRSWPFDRHEARLVAEKEHVNALAVDSTGELLALTAWPSIEVWQLGRQPGEGAFLLRALERGAVSGTGDGLDWHPQSTFVAQAGANRATVFTAQLETFWSVKSLYASDVRFTSDGALLAVGDWSKGAVYEWPPG